MTFHRSLLPSTQGASMLVVQMTTQTLYPCREQQSTAHTPQCSPNELFCEGRTLSQKILVSFTDLSKMQTLTPLKSHLRDDFCMPFPSRCIRKLAGLPDHLVRLEEEHRGNGQAEGLGGLQVDDQLELYRLLDREVGGFSAFQNLVYVGGGSVIHIRVAHAVGDQPPG